MSQSRESLGLPDSEGTESRERISVAALIFIELDDGSLVFSLGEHEKRSSTQQLFARPFGGKIKVEARNQPWSRIQFELDEKATELDDLVGTIPAAQLSNCIELIRSGIGLEPNAAARELHEELGEDLGLSVEELQAQLSAGLVRMKVFDSRSPSAGLITHYIHFQYRLTISDPDLCQKIRMLTTAPKAKICIVQPGELQRVQIRPCVEDDPHELPFAFASTCHDALNPPVTVAGTSRVRKAQKAIAGPKTKIGTWLDQLSQERYRLGPDELSLLLAHGDEDSVIRLLRLLLANRDISIVSQSLGTTIEAIAVYASASGESTAVTWLLILMFLSFRNLIKVRSGKAISDEVQENLLEVLTQIAARTKRDRIVFPNSHQLHATPVDAFVAILVNG